MEQNQKIDETKKERRSFGIPRQGVGLLVLAILASLLLHFGSYVNLSYLTKHYGTSNPSLPLATEPKRKPITVKLRDKVKRSDDDLSQRIVEAPMEKTAKPKVPRFKGAQDHSTEKETKVSPLRERPKAKDPGQGKKGGTTMTIGKASEQLAEPPKEMVMTQKVKPNVKETQKAQEKVVEGNRKPLYNQQGLKIQAGERKPRNALEALMPTSSELAQVVKEGYQDYIDEEIEEGDRIDINTSDYRFIGYFTALRKAFELVWSYPPEAIRRGLDGEVVVQFTILKDGSVRKIKVLKKSGHEILDNAVVNAIQLASPYSPLPDGLGKDKLTVSGTFRYVLSNYAGGH